MTIYAAFVLGLLIGYVLRVRLCEREDCARCRARYAARLVGAIRRARAEARQETLAMMWGRHHDCCARCTAGMGAAIIEREKWQEDPAA